MLIKFKDHRNQLFQFRFRPKNLTEPKLKITENSENFKCQKFRIRNSNSENSENSRTGIKLKCKNSNRKPEPEPEFENPGISEFSEIFRNFQTRENSIRKFGKLENSGKFQNWISENSRKSSKFKKIPELEKIQKLKFQRIPPNFRQIPNSGKTQNFRQILKFSEISRKIQIQNSRKFGNRKPENFQISENSSKKNQIF